MNTLKFYPKLIRKIYEQNIINSGAILSPERYHNKILMIVLFLTILSSMALVIFSKSLWLLIPIFLLFNVFAFSKISLDASARIKKMEDNFSDVISLMASNLKSGITIDRAFLLSARPEFAPLDQEILKTGKEIATGKDVVYALMNMSERIGSEKIRKTVLLIISGLRAGGNVANLLEETANNMKEKDFIEKRAASNILMYTIFIFFAVGVGAPLLFGVSSVLVEVIMGLASKMPASSVATEMPIAFKEVSISPSFVIYFSITFIIVTDLISSLVIGLVNKGEEKAGLRYFVPLTGASILLFFGIRLVLTAFLSEAISIF